MSYGAMTPAIEKRPSAAVVSDPLPGTRTTASLIGSPMGSRTTPLMVTPGGGGGEGGAVVCNSRLDTPPADRDSPQQRLLNRAARSWSLLARSCGAPGQGVIIGHFFVRVVWPKQIAPRVAQ